MTDLAQSKGKKKTGLDTILGANAISNAAEAINPASMTGEKKNKKSKTLIGPLGGGNEQLGGV